MPNPFHFTLYKIYLTMRRMMKNSLVLMTPSKGPLPHSILLMLLLLSITVTPAYPAPLVRLFCWP